MKRLMGWLEKALDAFTILMTVGIVVCVALQVVFRFVLHYPAPWTEEVARYMYVYLTFIGSALAVKEKTHITIDLLVEKLPKLLKTVILLLVQCGVIFFLVIVAIGSWGMVKSSTDVSSASLIWLKMSYIYFALFAGSVLMIFYSLIRIGEIGLEFFRSGMPKESGERQERTVGQ